MRWKEIVESASAGATGSASVATVVGGLGAGFDPNGHHGIYQQAKKKPIVLKHMTAEKPSKE